MPVSFVARADLSDAIAELERNGQQIVSIVPDVDEIIIITRPSARIIETRTA
jgi:hypothetical protein